MPRFWFSLPLAALVTLVVGCRPVKLAGDPVGQYRVTGTLKSSTCGAGHPAPTTLTFYVELRAEPDSTRGYWKLPNGPLVAGDLDDGEFRFEERTHVVAVPADPANNVAGCTLERVEVVDGELEGETLATDAGVTDRADSGATDEEGFSGRTVIGITPVPGGNCTPLLSVYGGPFPVLPCEVRYELEAKRVQEPIL